MSSSQVQMECERWIVQAWLPDRFGVPFDKQRMTMQGRGHFEFDAVSSDKKIIANISTAPAFTYQGKVASGKKSKLRADCLMLSLGSAERKIMVLTESCMHKMALKEQSEGRLPLDIEFCLVELPVQLQERLIVSRDKASLEVRGNKHADQDDDV